MMSRKEAPRYSSRPRHVVGTRPRGRSTPPRVGTGEEQPIDGAR